MYTDHVMICDHVWICENVTICFGVTTGENSIIGAEAVVTKNIPVDSIAVGNLVRVLREINNAIKQRNHRQFCLTCPKPAL